MRDLTRFEVVLITVLLVVAFILILPALQRPRNGISPETLCRHNLHMLALGLHNYHDIHGSFPPTWVAGQRWRPCIAAADSVMAM